MRLLLLICLLITFTVLPDESHAQRVKTRHVVVCDYIGLLCYNNEIAYVDISSFYAFGSFGLSSNAADYFIESENQANSSTFFVDETTLDTGVLFGGGIGYRKEFFRGDLEIAHRIYGTGRFFTSSGNGDSESTKNGSISATSFLVNLYTHLPPINTAKVIIDPYFGLGVGGVRLSVSDIPANNVSNGTFTIDDSETAFAFGFHAGVEFLPQSGPWSLRTQYRWFGHSAVDLEDSNGNAVVADGLGAHELLLSINYYWDE